MAFWVFNRNLSIFNTPLEICFKFRKFKASWTTILFIETCGSGKEMDWAWYIKNLCKLADTPFLDDLVVEKLFNNCYLGSKTSVSETAYMHVKHI